LPPLTGVAVKVTGVFAQILPVAVDAIETDGITDGLITIVITFELAVGLTIQGMLLVTMQLTWSPFFKVLLVKPELSVPAFTPFTIH
jgi:hypothetical protein